MTTPSSASTPSGQSHDSTGPDRVNSMRELDVVTGATGYSGTYIARKLLDAGRRVRTLTGHPNRPNPFGSRIEVVPYHFDEPDLLRKDLEGVATVYNTYWIRFPHGRCTFDRAIANTKRLIRAAEEAKVRRFVHISIANPSKDSPLGYYRGKAALEAALADSSLSWAILRPTVIFGPEDILINNIAWMVRHFPIFVVPGSGEYQLQPIFVEDFAEIAVRAASKLENVTMDTVGLEAYTFNKLVWLIVRTLRRSVRIAHVHPSVAYLLTRTLGLVVRDIILTREEIAGLTANLLVSNHPPLGRTSLSQWLEENSDRVGRRYASELARHYR
ncbi:MAG TPA: NAD(P)H-binding protein [Terriglobia bacterium]|nr:NAD(P)H-binding protein [Terriglobia bacterium]